MASAIALALPSSVLLLACPPSPDTFIPPTTIRPIGLPVAIATAAGATTPGVLLPDELSVPDTELAQALGRHLVALHYSI